MFQSSLIIITAVGLLLLVAALGWRGLHRARMRTRIAEALDHHDPQRRRAGVLVATEQGLRAHADLLADHLDDEDDEVVLDTLVEGVLRNSWEPADQPSILALRLWAHERRDPGAAGPEKLEPGKSGPAVFGSAVFGSAEFGSAEFGTAVTQILPAVRTAAPQPPPATRAPSMPARRARREGGRQAEQPAPGTAPRPDESFVDLPAQRRAVGRARRFRSDPPSPSLDRRSRRAAARRAAAIAAVTPMPETAPEPNEDRALVPMPRGEFGRSPRARLEPPSMPARRDPRRDPGYPPRPARQPLSDISRPVADRVKIHRDETYRDDVHFASEVHAGGPAGRPRPWTWSNRNVDEPPHGVRRRARLAAVPMAAVPMAAAEPEPAPRRGARHRAEPGQLRFTRSDI